MRIFRQKDKFGSETGPFWYDLRVKGRRLVRSTGSYDRETAEQLAWGAREDVVSGEWDRRQKVQRRPLTFKALADRFVAEYRGRRGQLRTPHYKQKLTAVKAALGDRNPADLTAHDLERFRDDRLTAGLAPASVKKELTAIGTVFRWGRRAGLLDANPAEFVAKPKEAAGRHVYIDRDGWPKISAAAPDWLRPMLDLAVATGLRLKEVVQLRHEDVDRKRGELYVSGDNKTGTAAQVPLSGAALAAIDAAMRHVRSPHVFTSTHGEPYTSEASRRRISRITAALLARHGVDGGFHVLRHTFASWWLQAGGSLDALRPILRHSRTDLTQRYAHLSPDFHRKAAKRIDGFIPGRRADRKAAIVTPRVGVTL